MANLAYMRREEWLMDASHTDGFENKYFNGSIPLINPKHHTFRDLDSSNKGFSPYRSQYKSVSLTVYNSKIS